MAAAAITAANVIASAQALKVTVPAGATITAGQSVYVDSAGVAQLTDSDLSATAAKCDGIALNGGAAGQPITIVTDDPDFQHGATLAAGDTVWTSPTAGGITKTIADLATGQFTIVLGVCTSATKMVLRPIRSGVAHA